MDIIDQSPADFDHLFRHESGRMVATLSRAFGIQNLALAEDAVQDAFCRALEIWKHRGVPDNPAAWLLAAAKRRAVDVLRRRQTERVVAPELRRLLQNESSVVPAVDELFATEAISDDLLRMMFSCCHPQLSEEAQVALILHILCGFSVDEVASAFISSHAAIEKRIPRAKKVLATCRTLFDISAPTDFSDRLPAVQRALYLLFSEGYHGASAEFAVRFELCREAMRLTSILLDHPFGATPATNALAALMSLNAARLPARVDTAGQLNSLFNQDRSLWNQELIGQGLGLLERSATGSELSAYHIEAAIAAVHASARSAEETNWERVVSLYDTLVAIRPSPVVALNRAIAVGQHEGPERGLEEIRSIVGTDRLAAYPFFSAAVGEFELRLGNQKLAREQFQNALALARNPAERAFFERRIDACVAAATERPTREPRRDLPAELFT